MVDGPESDRRGAAETRPRRRRRRSSFGIPGLARRGRATLLHLVGLLLGAYVRSVAERRELGARGPLFAFERLLSLVARLFVDSKIASLPFPEQLRRRLESLGPTYVKLGQILSLRSDILPRAVTDELKNLLSRLPPLPFEEIRAVIEEDLGLPLERAFVEVDPVPIGSASIAQTHRATTTAGQAVILKVVKPGIRELLHRDAALLRGFAWMLQLTFARYQPRRIIDEFFEYTLREVDMRLEAENAEAFAVNFRDQPDIVFPAVYRSLSGNQVLCMEYLEGRQPDLVSVASLTPEERTRLLDLGALAIIRMLYEDGFFHADLHPGNLLILPGTRVGFIDLGMAGRLDPSLRTHLLYHFFCLIGEDYENAARHLAAVAEHGPGADVGGYRRAVKELARRWRRAATAREYSLAALILESIRLGARYRMYYPLEMVLMVKALVTYEGVGYMLDPDFNVSQVSQRHVSRIVRQHFNPLRLLRETLRGAPELVEMLVKLPLLVSEGLDLVERQSRRQPDNPFTGLRGTVFGGSCLIAGAVLAGLGGPWLVWGPLLLIGLLVSRRRGA